MGNVSKNSDLAKLKRLKKEINKNLKKQAFGLYISENSGKEIKMSDRTYIITNNGSYHRVETKEEILSKRKGK